MSGLAGEAQSPCDRGRILSGFDSGTAYSAIEEPRRSPDSPGPVADNYAAFFLVDDRLDSAKLLLEVGLGEHQGGRTAVRAVVRVGHQVPALQKSRDLWGRKGLAGLDGRLAGDHVQELGQQSVAGRRQGLRAEVFGQVADQALGHHVREHRRDAPHQHGIAAERLDLQAELGQKLTLLDERRRFGCRQVHRLGDQQPLRLDSPLGDRLRSSSYKIRSWSACWSMTIMPSPVSAIR